MIVLYASVWVSRLVPTDARHAASRDWLGHYVSARGGLVVPVLLLSETAGAVARRAGDPSLGIRAIQHLLRFPGLRVVAVEQRLGQASAILAARLSLRGADAIHAALAQVLGIPLVTWNDEQRARAGVAVVVYTPDTWPWPPSGA